MQRLWKRYGYRITFVLVLVLILFLAQLWMGASHPTEGSPAPAFEALGLEGAPFKLEDHLGKSVILLDFWASWCPPCRWTLPKIAAIEEEFKAKGLLCRAVNLQESPEQVKAFLEKSDLSLEVLLDKQGSIASQYQVQGIPHIVLIDKSGLIHKVFVGAPFLLEVKLRRLFKDLL